MVRRSLDSKRIVLTGASSGLGKAIAYNLSKFKPSLLLNARRESELQELSSKLNKQGIECDFIVGDITDPSIQRAAINKCREQFGGLDILINNAGIGAMGLFVDASAETLRQVFELNFFALAELTRAAVPYLAEGNDPIIVNIGSVLGHRGVPLKSEYCASKFAVHGFSDALRSELVQTGIEVLHVCPATIDTEFFDSAVEDTTGKNWKAGSAMSPDYVAKKIVRAIEYRKHEIILPFSAKLLAWFDRIAPGIANRLVARFGR